MKPQPQSNDSFIYGPLPKKDNERLLFSVSDEIKTPWYLDENYWWAYLHPKGVNFFDRTWIVNTILFGNFISLRDKAVAELDENAGKCLQISAVYGDITPKIAQKIGPNNPLDVIDVAPIQLQNVGRKVKSMSNVKLYHQDSTQLKFQDDSYETVIIFFLLHEQPDAVKLQTIKEAIRVLKPGGKIIVVDYYKPAWWNPFRYFMPPLLRLLEPFTLPLWKREIIDWFPKDFQAKAVRQTKVFGGLYQKVVIET